MCQAKYQFSCWNSNDPSFASLSGAKAIPFRELAQARIAADHVIDGKVPDPKIFFFDVGWHGNNGRSWPIAACHASGSRKLQGGCYWGPEPKTKHR